MLSGYCDFDALSGAVNEANIFRFLPKPWNDEDLLQTVDDTIIHCHPQPIEFLTRKETIHKSLNFSQQPLFQAPSTPQPSAQAALPSIADAAVPALLEGSPAPSQSENTSESFSVNNIEESFLKKQILLEKDINNDELSLTQSSIINIDNCDNTLHYLLLNWPRYQRFNHDHIIDMARQAGYLKDLYTWYTLKCTDTCYTQEALQQDTPKKVVIDLFCEEMIDDKSLKSIILSIMRQNCHLVFRIPFSLLEKESLYSLLKETYISSSSIMLNIGKRIIDAGELQHTNVQYLELDARYNTIRNSSITEKRIKMLGDAQNLSIKTILTEVKDPEQFLYAKKMNIDFFSSKLHNGFAID